MWSLTEWRRQRILAQHPVASDVWHSVRQRLSILDGLDDEQDKWLRDNSVLFLKDKHLTPMPGVELTEEGRNLKFKKHKDIDIFNSLTDEEKENLNDYLNRLLLAVHDKFRDEEPEKYEKIIKNRRKIFEKYFKNDNNHEEWIKLMM